ncbi:MAG: transcriptional repressor NrdR [Kiritimatiellae bacterium]|nr:transcriptional repressor NrdR [Kiritimatiellia bacterium]
MRCPKCGKDNDKVLDSRSARDGAVIRRRRQCIDCQYRYTTFEEIVRDELRVKKRDGTSEEFSREKLRRGIMRACEKRPISKDQIQDLIDQVLEAFDNLTEVTTQQVGEEVMRRLHAIDDVAYVRFASVYRRFHDVEEFVQTIKQMERKSSKTNQVKSEE